EVARMYRDSRINRIFEGTNEINRLIVPGTLIKKAMKGELPLLEQAQGLQDELMSMMPEEVGDEPLDQEKHLLRNAKNIVLIVLDQLLKSICKNQKTSKKFCLIWQTWLRTYVTWNRQFYVQKKPSVKQAKRKTNKNYCILKCIHKNHLIKLKVSRKKF